VIPSRRENDVWVHTCRLMEVEYPETDVGRIAQVLRADQEETPPSLEQPLPRPTLSLGIKARGVELPQEKIKYVTETNATRKIVPLKLSSVGVDESKSGMSSEAASRLSSLPKWAQCLRDRACLRTPGMELSGTGRNRLESEPVQSHPLALATKFDSDASFKWSPEDVLVQSWHRKLTDGYRDYNMVNVVGEGRSGAVFIVQHKKSEKYHACKLLNKADHDKDTLRREIKMMRQLDHPNVVRLYETIEDSESVFLVMELCHGGDLFGRIHDEGQLDEGLACVFAEQMLSALAYCHSRGIVHRDVKPENFLLEKDDPDCTSLKLADFGISTSIRPDYLYKGRFNSVDSESMFGSSVGTGSCVDSGSTVSSPGGLLGSLPYMAPEMLSQKWRSLVNQANGDAKTLAAGDLWSTGVVIYVMLSGELPFGTDREAICSGQLPDFSGEVWRNVSGEATDLIKHLLNPIIEERLTAQQALHHPWFQREDGSTSTFAPSEMSRGQQPLDPDDTDSRRDLATELLLSLRRWRQLPKLRRISIAAVARRLETDHKAQVLAKLMYNTFNDMSESMPCNRLVSGLATAINARTQSTSFDKYSAPSAEKPLSSSAERLKPRFADQGGQSSFGSTLSDRNSVTGLFLRHRVRTSLRRVTQYPRLDGSPQSNSTTASLSELRYLVDALDAAKNSVVDYTLLVAALLPPEVYCDGHRISEVFQLFDVQNRSLISHEDLAIALSSKYADSKRFKEMVADFDLDGDGFLDLTEFKNMVRGHGWEHRSWQAGD